MLTALGLVSRMRIYDSTRLLLILHLEAVNTTSCSHKKPLYLFRMYMYIQCSKQGREFTFCLAVWAPPDIFVVFML